MSENEDTPSNRQLSIDFLKGLKGKRQINRDGFQSVITNLTKECFSGFTEEEVKTLVDCLLTIQLAAVRFNELITCIVPEQKVPDSVTTRVLNWLFTHYCTAPITNIIVTVQWITGLLDFGLANEKPIQGFYQHYFLLFQRRKLIPYACKLIYLLTKPSLVCRWRVKKLLKLERCHGKKNYTSALLCLFKSYKPECVPETIPAMSAQQAFKMTESKLNYRFEKAQLRVRVSTGEQGQLYKALLWNVDIAKRKTSKRQKLDLMPSLDYIRFGASIYTKNELYSILEFNSMVSLGCFQLSLEMPSNAMALLQNSAGLHILAFGDKTIQTRLAYNLYYSLYRAFLEKDVEYSYEEKDRLLTQVAALQEYLQQGISVVSRFLGQYLLSWDGEDFQENILKLLQWLSFSLPGELFQIVLSPIKTLFVISDVNMKCSIIEMLTKLQQNLILVGLYRKQNGFRNLFLDVQDTWDAKVTLQTISDFINELCIFGIAYEQGNYMLIDKMLSYYELISELEEEMSLSLWTMMPPLLVYSCLFSKNIIFLCHACTLLLKYKNVVYPRFRDHGQLQHVVKQLTMKDVYISDFGNCLLENRSLLRSEMRYLLTGVPKKQIESFSRFVSIDDDITLPKHIAFVPMRASSLMNDTVRSSELTSHEAVMQMLEESYPDIFRFLHSLIQ